MFPEVIRHIIRPSEKQLTKPSNLSLNSVRLAPNAETRPPKQCAGESEAQLMIGLWPCLVLALLLLVILVPSRLDSLEL